MSTMLGDLPMGSRRSIAHTIEVVLGTAPCGARLLNDRPIWISSILRSSWMHIWLVHSMSALFKIRPQAAGYKPVPNLNHHCPPRSGQSSQGGALEHHCRFIGWRAKSLGPKRMEDLHSLRKVTSHTQHLPSPVSNASAALPAFCVILSTCNCMG